MLYNSVIRDHQTPSYREKVQRTQLKKNVNHVITKGNKVRHTSHLSFHVLSKIIHLTFKRIHGSIFCSDHHIITLLR